MSPRSGEDFRPIPLKDVIGTMYVSQDGGERQPVSVKFTDLNGTEQRLVNLIVAGRFGAARKLTNDGQKQGFDPNRISAVLEAAVQQHNPGLTEVVAGPDVAAALGR
jgi:hypothetical protein